MSPPEMSVHLRLFEIPSGLDGGLLIWIDAMHVEMHVRQSGRKRAKLPQTEL